MARTYRYVAAEAWGAGRERLVANQQIRKEGHTVRVEGLSCKCDMYSRFVFPSFVEVGEVG